MSVAVPGRTAIPDPGGAATTTAGPGTIISGGVASPVFATPLSAEVDGSDEIVALFDPEHEDGLSLGTGDGVRVVLDPATSAALSVGASGVVASYTNLVRINGSSFDGILPALNKVDLTAPLSTLDPNSLAPTIAAQGNGYRVTVTTQATARDGADEMYRQRHAFRDAAGNVVDISTGDWVIVIEVRRKASTVGSSIIVVAGPSTRATTTGGQHALLGYCTGPVAGSLQRCLVTSPTTNSVSNDSALDVVRCVFTTIGNSGNYRLPGGTLVVYTSAEALSSETQFTSQEDSAPGTVGLSVGIGTDFTTIATDSTDVEIWHCAYKMPAVGL